MFCRLIAATPTIQGSSGVGATDGWSKQMPRALHSLVFIHPYPGRSTPRSMPSNASIGCGSRTMLRTFKTLDQTNQASIATAAMVAASILMASQMRFIILSSRVS
jgi:hypothetical protein